MDKNQKIILYISSVFLFVMVCFHLFFSPPASFQAPAVFRVEEGKSLRAVSLKLKQENIIRSRTVFESIVIMYGGERHIQHADYYFESKLPVWMVARRIAKGEHNMAPVVVTIPEGFDNSQIALTFAPKLLNFDKDKFLTEAEKLEGYLFPDTYFFSTTATDQDVLRSMNGNFEKKMLVFRPEIALSEKTTGRTEREIIIMASIIEREAKGEIKGKTDREFISGILWKRLSMGMPLQVDAAPETYKVKGLPKSPIANPGLQAIEAAIHPQNSRYLYYLHDKEGNIHYAASFAEHKRNIDTYLKN